MGGVMGGVMSFEFAAPARIIVGAGRAAELPAAVAGLGTRALVCTGSHPERHATLVSSLPIPSTVVPIPEEPTVDRIRSVTAVARDYRADVVIAIGGGSVIDSGKAVSALLGNDGDPMEYLEVVGRGRRIARPPVPCCAVPTTAGAGAEATANAVLTVPERGVKVSMRSPMMIPRIALVDPLLTLDCPPAVTAASGLDALTQCLEPLVSVKANPVTDGLAREGLLRAARGLRRAYQDGSDVAARTDMSVCSLLGGMALANAKLGAVHGFAGVLGGLDPGRGSAAHGVLCAALLAPVVEANVLALCRQDPGGARLLRYREIARLLTGNPDATVEDGVAWIRETTELLAVPSLGALGFAQRHADEVVRKVARASSTQGNPVVLSDGELCGIFAAALG